MEYPPNSKMGNTGRPPEKKVEQVTSADVKRRKKSLGKQFRETFVVGDARTAMHYVVLNVLIPEAKDMMADAVTQGFERLIFGDSRKRGRSPASAPTGYVNYQGMNRGARSPAPSRTISQRGRSRHDFDEIVLESRTEAEEVIDRLFDIVSKYEEATVADLYLLTGLPSTHTDHTWGWTDLRGSGVSRLRGDGYLLNLPEPTPLK